MCPGSYIRRAWGATPSRESPEVQVPAARPDSGRGRLVQGASNARGRSIKRTLQRRYRVHQELPSGALKANCGIGSAEPFGGRRRPAPAGKESDACTRRAPRRMGGGTERRIGDAKRGRSPRQPRPDRMAKTRRITANTGSRREAWRLAAEAVVAMTARTTQPRSSEGPLGECGRCLQGRPGVVPVWAITRRGTVPVRLRASGPCPAAAAKAAGQPRALPRHSGWSVSPSRLWARECGC